MKYSAEQAGKNNSWTVVAEENGDRWQYIVSFDEQSTALRFIENRLERLYPPDIGVVDSSLWVKVPSDLTQVYFSEIQTQLGDILKSLEK